MGDGKRSGRGWVRDLATLPYFNYEGSPAASLYEAVSAAEDPGNSGSGEIPALTGMARHRTAVPSFGVEWSSLKERLAGRSMVADAMRAIATTHEPVVYQYRQGVVMALRRAHRDTSIEPPALAGNKFYPGGVLVYDDYPERKIPNKVTPFYGVTAEPVDVVYYATFLLLLPDGEMAVVVDVSNQCHAGGLGRLLDDADANPTLVGHAFPSVFYRWQYLLGDASELSPDRDVSAGGLIRLEGGSDHNFEAGSDSIDADDRWLLSKTVSLPRKARNLWSGPPTSIQSHEQACALVGAAEYAFDSLDQLARSLATDVWHIRESPGYRASAQREAARSLAKASAPVSGTAIAKGAALKVGARVGVALLASLVGAAANWDFDFDFDADFPDGADGFSFDGIDGGAWWGPDVDVSGGVDGWDAPADVGDSSSASVSEVRFGAEVSTRFDTDLTTPAGHTVGSDAAGNLVDKVTGAAVDKTETT